LPCSSDIIRGAIWDAGLVGLLVDVLPSAAPAHANVACMVLYNCLLDGGTLAVDPAGGDGGGGARRARELVESPPGAGVLCHVLLALQSTWHNDPEPPGPASAAPSDQTAEFIVFLLQRLLALGLLKPLFDSVARRGLLFFFVMDFSPFFPPQAG
jgi:hypothetical protein